MPDLRARIEAALCAADDLADAAREMNDGPDSDYVAKCIAAYRKACRGLDLRLLRTENATLIATGHELFEAATKALNFIANTEGELGITLDSGDALRAAITKASGGECS